MKNIEEKIDKINSFFSKMEKHQNLKERDLMIRKVLKIGEEYGELCEAMLSDMGLARDKKLEKYSREDFEKELADVILASLTLGRYLNLSLEEMINKRLEVVFKRLESEYSNQKKFKN